MNVKISALVGDKYYLLSEGLVDLAKREMENLHNYN